MSWISLAMRARSPSTCARTCSCCAPGLCGRHLGLLGPQSVLVSPQAGEQAAGHRQAGAEQKETRGGDDQRADSQGGKPARRDRGPLENAKRAAGQQADHCKRDLSVIMQKAIKDAYAKGFLARTFSTTADTILTSTGTVARALTKSAKNPPCMESLEGKRNSPHPGFLPRRGWAVGRADSH